MKFIYFLISILEFFIFIKSDSTIDFSSLTEGTGYSVSDNIVTITASGTYTLTGTSTTGSLVIADSLTDINLIFNSLSLTSTSKTLLTIGSYSSVNIQISQISTLDTTGYSAIKLNSNATLSINGSSTLSVKGTYGFEGDNTTTLTINSGIISITATTDGIYVGKAITINDGSLIITSSNYGINSPGTTSIASGTIVITSTSTCIYSNNNVIITGGTITLSSESLNGIHADYNITIGNENGNDDDLTLTITKCDEGIEGAIIKVYSGTIIITSTDDGINVQNSFYGTDSYDSTAEISMNFYGGNVYVNAEGDGLDANGDINIYGGSLQVWGMAAGGDNEPVDHDDNLIINDATLIVGGSKGTSYTHNGITSTNQYSIYTTESITSGTTVYVKDEENNTVETIAVPKNIDYLFYSSKSVTSSFYFATSSGNISTTYFDGNSQNQEGPNGDRPSGPGEQGDGPGQNNTNNTNSSSSSKSVSSSESDVSSSESDGSSSESDDSSKGNYIYFSMILNILIFICIHI